MEVISYWWIAELNVTNYKLKNIPNICIKVVKVKSLLKKNIKIKSRKQKTLLML